MSASMDDLQAIAIKAGLAFGSLPNGWLADRAFPFLKVVDQIFLSSRMF